MPGSGPTHPSVGEEAWRSWVSRQRSMEQRSLVLPHTLERCECIAGRGTGATLGVLVTVSLGWKSFNLSKVCSKP